MPAELTGKAVGIDFDGVIHSYERGWQDGAIYGTPIPGAFDAIRQMQADGHPCFIFTSRCDQLAEIAEWITDRSRIPCCVKPDYAEPFWNDTTMLLVTSRKLGAGYYIDDRAIRFEDWEQAAADLAFHEAMHAVKAAKG